MSLQHERILALCGELKLQQMPHCYEPLATEAVQREVSYSDYLENVLRGSPRRTLAGVAHAHGGVPRDQDLGTV